MAIGPKEEGLRAARLKESDKKAIAYLKKEAARSERAAKAIDMATRAFKSKRATTRPAKEKRTHGPRKGDKSALIETLLRQSQGCTTAEVLSATGWSAVSMPDQAKRLGVELRKEKKPGESTRYWIEPPV